MATPRLSSSTFNLCTNLDDFYLEWESTFTTALKVSIRTPVPGAETKNIQAIQHQAISDTIAALKSLLPQSPVQTE